MSFNLSIKSKELSSFITSMSVVLNEGFINVSSEGFNGIGLNISNTLFVDTRLPITIDCEPHTMSLDVSRISAVITAKDDEIKLSYDGTTLKAIIGKTTYKFVSLSAKVMREPRKPTTKFTMFCNNIPTSDFYDAVKAIEQYNKDESRYYKCVVMYDSNDNTLHMIDEFDNVDTILKTYDDAILPSTITVKTSTDLLTDLATYAKKFEKEMTIGFVGNDAPIQVLLPNTSYMVAPRVDID